MIISAEYDEGLYVIRNSGRILATYTNWPEFNQAMNKLDKLKSQLARPEAFCDCQDLYTKGKR